MSNDFVPPWSPATYHLSFPVWGGENSTHIVLDITREIG